jgi:hypothetical protein
MFILYLSDNLDYRYPITIKKDIKYNLIFNLKITPLKISN